MLNLEQQVVSLELAKKMKELGFPQQSLFWWNMNTKPATIWADGYLNEKEWNEPLDIYSAYTVGELGYFLEIVFRNLKGTMITDPGGYWKRPRDYYWKRLWQRMTGFENEPQHRAEALIYLAEKGLLDTKKLG